MKTSKGIQHGIPSIIAVLLTAGCMSGNEQPVNDELLDQPTDNPRQVIGKGDQVLYGSCHLSNCNGLSPNGNCYCDEQCSSFGDCCADYATICTAGSAGCDLVAGCEAGSYCPANGQDTNVNTCQSTTILYDAAINYLAGELPERTRDPNREVVVLRHLQVSPTSNVDPTYSYYGVRVPLDSGHEVFVHFSLASSEPRGFWVVVPDEIRDLPPPWGDTRYVEPTMLSVVLEGVPETTELLGLIGPWVDQVNLSDLKIISGNLAFWLELPALDEVKTALALGSQPPVLEAWPARVIEVVIPGLSILEDELDRR